MRHCKATKIHGEHSPDLCSEDSNCLWMNEGVFLIAEEKAKQCFCSSFRGKDTLVCLLIQHDLERQDGIFHDDFINEDHPWTGEPGGPWRHKESDTTELLSTHITTVNFFSVIYLMASLFFFSHNWTKNLDASFCVVPSIMTWNYILNSYDSMYINKFWMFHWNIQVGKTHKREK